MRGCHRDPFSHFLPRTREISQALSGVDLDMVLRQRSKGAVPPANPAEDHPLFPGGGHALSPCLLVLDPQHLIFESLRTASRYLLDLPDKSQHNSKVGNVEILRQPTPRCKTLSASKHKVSTPPDTTATPKP